MAKLISISLLDEEVSFERLMDALLKLSSRDLRKYFKRKKMVFPRNLRYAFLTKCIKRDFLAVQKDLLDSNNRVFTEFELVEFYKCVDNEALALEFKKEFLAYFVNKTYKNLLTEKNLADLYSIAVAKEETASESIYGFLVGLNPMFTDTEENNLDCLPVETTAQRLKDQFTLFEVREFAKKYGVVIPKYPSAELIAPIVIEKATAKQLLDEEGLANLKNAESNVLLSFAKKHRIYVPRYLKKDVMIDEVISQIASKEIDNNKIAEVFNENLITFKSRSSSTSLCDLLDKYQNLDDLSEVRNDNSKDMSPLKRCAVGGAIGLELRYNEVNRKARLQERRRKLELLRQQAFERKEKLLRERKEEALIAQTQASIAHANEEEAKRLEAERRIAELEAQLREEEERRLAAERALEESRNVPEVVEDEPEVEETVETPVEEVVTETVVEEQVAEEETFTFGEEEVVVPEYVDTTVQEVYEVEETREVTVMSFETVEEEAIVPEVVEEEPVVEEVVEETVVEEVVEEETPVEEVVEETPVVEEETPVEEEPQPEEPAPVEEPQPEPTPEEEPQPEEEKPEPVRCPVRKMHVFGWIASILAVAAMAVLSMFLFKDSFNNLINEAAELKTGDYVLLFGLFYVAYGFVAFVIRAIFHKIRCKAKKGVACCKANEGYKYLWARLIIAVAAVFVLAQVHLLHFATVKDEIWTVINSKILSYDGSLADYQALLVILVALLAAYVVALLVMTLGRIIKRKKECKGATRHFIGLSWAFIITTILVFGALAVINLDVLTATIDVVVKHVSSVFSGKALVVNAASAEVVSNTGVSPLSYIFLALVALVVVYVLGVIILTIGYARRQKAKNKVEEPVVEEVPQEEPVVIPEELEDDGERLLFTTFEEAKLVEDLNDLNRMIGKVNEHVKDLSAIQARLYNELVGEEEIIIDPVVEPVVEETPVVIPETPVETPTIVVEPTPEPQPAPVEEPQPVEESTPAPVEEEPTPEPEPDPVPCPVRKKLAFGWLWSILAVAAAVCLCMFVFNDSFNRIVDNSATLVAADYVLLFGLLFVAYGVVAFIIRTIIHRIRCKAKKGIACRKSREGFRYKWTRLIVLALAVFAFIKLDVFHFVAIKDSVWEVINNKIISFNGGLDANQGLIVIFAVVVAAYVLTLFVLSFINLCKGKKAENVSPVQRFISFCWGIVIFTIILVVALVVLRPELGGALLDNIVDNVKSVFAVKTLVVNAASEEVISGGSVSPVAYVYLAIVAVVALYLLSLIGLTIGYSSHKRKKNPKPKKTKKAKKEKPTPAPVEETTPEEPTVPEEVPTEEVVVEEPKPVEKPKKAKKVKKEKVKKPKVKCPVRRTQKVWLVLTFIIIVAMIVCCAVIPTVTNFVKERVDFYNNTPIREWINDETFVKDFLFNYGILFAALLFVTSVISFLVRVLLHPIGCKAKKNKHCCFTCEWYKYVWTFVFVFAGLVALLALVPITIASKSYNFGIDGIASAIGFYINKGFNGFKTIESKMLLIVAVIVVLVFIALVIATFGHKIADRRASRPKVEEPTPVEEPTVPAPVEETPTVVEEPKPVEKTKKVKKEKVKKEKPKKVKKEKVKCSVRRTQKVWFVLLLVAVVAVAVCYGLGLLDSAVEFVKAKINFYNTKPISEWVREGHVINDLVANYGVLFAGLFAVVVVISFLVRFILHPIGCKAKKHKHCCLTCEWYKYLWTVVFVGAGLVAFLYTRDNNLGIKAIVDRLINFKSWTFKTAEGKVLIVGAALVAIIFIILVISTFAHKIRDRRNHVEEVVEDTTPENPGPVFQPNVAYVPCMLNGSLQFVPVNVPTVQPVVPQPAPQPAPVEEPKPVEKPKKVKKEKVKCSVRRTQKVWFVLLLVAVVAVAVCYGLGLLDSAVGYIKAKINFYNTKPLSEWVREGHVIRDLAARYGVLFAGLFAVVVVISFLVRFILHPIGCKAKKHKHCCLTCEWYKYLWTVVFVGAGLVAFLYTRDNNLGIKAIVDRLIDFKSWSFKTAEGKVLIVGAALVAIVFLFLVVKTFAHKIKDRRLAKHGNEEPTEEVPPQTGAPVVAPTPYVQPQYINVGGQVQPVQVPGVQPIYIYSQGVQNPAPVTPTAPSYVNPYNPGIYEDIQSPYNMYRVGENSSTGTYRSRRGFGFLKFLGVLVVLAAAYLFLAYKIEAIDFIGLFH